MTNGAQIDGVSNICNALLVVVRKTDIEHVANFNVTSSGCVEDVKKEQTHFGNAVNCRVTGDFRTVFPMAIDTGE